MMHDKDVESCIREIAPLFNKITCVTVENERSISANDLYKTAAEYCECCEICEDSAEAYDKSINQLKDNEMLLVCGSLYLASEILNHINAEKSS